MGVICKRPSFLQLLARLEESNAVQMFRFVGDFLIVIKCVPGALAVNPTSNLVNPSAANTVLPKCTVLWVAGSAASVTSVVGACSGCSTCLLAAVDPKGPSIHISRVGLMTREMHLSGYLVEHELGTTAQLAHKQKGGELNTPERWD